MIRLALLALLLVACHADAAPARPRSAPVARSPVGSWHHELKRRVAMNWHPAELWQRLDPSGSVYGRTTRVTELGVTLSSEGALLDLVVLHPSGVPDLDAEALRAFRAAAPFGPPRPPLPDGAAVRDGQMTFSFSLTFEAQARNAAPRRDERHGADR